MFDGKIYDLKQKSQDQSVAKKDGDQDQTEYFEITTFAIGEIGRKSEVKRMVFWVLLLD